MKAKELAALAKLRNMRLDKAEAELARVRTRMRHADAKLVSAEQMAASAQRTAQKTLAEFAASRPCDIMTLLDGRKGVAAAHQVSADAAGQVEDCHKVRILLLDEQVEAWRRWRDRQRQVESWDHVVAAQRDIDEQRAMRREDSEDFSRFQAMLGAKKD
jgi:hypothetical protein